MHVFVLFLGLKWS